MHVGGAHEGDQYMWVKHDGDQCSDKAVKRAKEAEHRT